MNFLKEHFYGGSLPFELDKLIVKGADAKKYLNGQSTNNIESLNDNEMILDTLLDIKGKVQAVYIAHQKSEQEFNLYVLQHDNISERLNKFIIMDDVEVINPEEKLQLTLNKTNKFKFLGVSANIEECSEIISSNYLSMLGFEQWVGQSITDTILVEHAVDFSKGCFLGQEIVAKIHNNRGAVFYPVILESSEGITEKEFKIEDKKIKILSEIKERTYLAKAHRDLRINNRELSHQSVKIILKLLPYLNHNNKAQDLYHIAVDEFNKNNEQTALELLNRVIEIDPAFADAYESIGVILGRQDKLDEAIGFMKRLLQVNPDSVLAHTNLSLFYMRQGKIEEAEEEKSQATLATFNQLGKEAEDKRTAEAKKKQEQDELLSRESMFKQVLELDGNDTLALFGMGDIEFLRGNYEQSIKHLEKVLVNDEKYSVAYLKLGEAYKELGNKQKAKEVFEKGVKVAASKGDMMPANQMQSYLNSL
jgi:tetratricopeptide (TPR) repeat protein